MKKIRLTILGVIIMLFLTGCVNCNVNMNIKKNKSMNFTIEYTGNNVSELLSKEDIQNLKDNKFKYKEDTNSVVFSKKYHNIDKISSTSLNTVNILDIIKNDTKIFNVKRGFLKNTYTVKINKSLSQPSNGDDLAISLDGNKIKVYLFASEGCLACHRIEEYINTLNSSEIGYMFEFVKYSVYDENWNMDSHNKSIMDQVAQIKGDTIVGVPYLVIGENYSLVGYNDAYNEDIKNAIINTYNGQTYNDIVQGVIDAPPETEKTPVTTTSEFEEATAWFTINLPYKPLNNNADKVSDDMLNLSWNILDGNKENIELTFELYNYEYLYVISFVLVVVIIALSVIVLKSKKINSDSLTNNTNNSKRFN